MESIILPTLAFVSLAYVGYRQSRGFMSLPTICLVYFTCIYVGGVRLWFQEHSNTYLYVLIAAGAFVLGLVIMRKLEDSRKRRIAIKRPQLDIGMHPKILLYTLSTLTIISLLLWAYWLWRVGSPLLEGSLSVGWVKSSAGATHRFLASLGGENLAFVGLGWYALYKAWRRNPVYLALALGGVIGGAMFMALQGSKGSAVMTVLWFGIVLFYFNRHTPKLRTFVLMALFAIPVTWWVTSYFVYFPGQTPASIVYDRVTTQELEGLNYLVQTWVPRYGFLHGHTFAMDIARIKAQVLGGPRPVVFHEYIWNLMNGGNPYDSQRLSESLTLFGVGYANFGLPGGILFMLVFGAACEVLDAYLMTAKRIHFVLFAIGIYSVMALLNVLSSGDVLILGMETLLLQVAPKLFAFLAIYAFFALPFRIPFRWSRATRKGPKSSASGGMTRRDEGNQPVGIRSWKAQEKLP